MNMLMNGTSPVGMVYNQSAENIAYDSNNSVKDMIDEIGDWTLLGTLTQAETEYTLSQSVVNFKSVKAIMYLYASDRYYFLDTKDIPLSYWVSGNQVVCNFYDGTIRKGQFGVISNTKVITSGSQNFYNISGILIYGIS